MIRKFENVEVRNFDTGEEYVDDCYGVECDGCGELHEHTDYGCTMMTNEDEIEEDATLYGGYVKAYLGNRELHFCPDCCHPVSFADEYGVSEEEDKVYFAAFVGLDPTHNVRYLILDDEIIGTSIVTK